MTRPRCSPYYAHIIIASFMLWKHGDVQSWAAFFATQHLLSRICFSSLLVQINVHILPPSSIRTPHWKYPSKFKTLLFRSLFQPHSKSTTSYFMSPSYFRLRICVNKLSAAAGCVAKCCKMSPGMFIVNNVFTCLHDVNEIGTLHVLLMLIPKKITLFRRKKLMKKLCVHAGCLVGTVLFTLVKIRILLCMEIEPLSSAEMTFMCCCFSHPWPAVIIFSGEKSRGVEWKK